MILRRIFSNKSGFYVDIGAHHPVRFSNTLYFYKKGWNGINIDALPGTKILFDRYRKRDINLELLVSNKEFLEYYLFSEPAYNTTDRTLIEGITSKGVKLMGVKNLKCKKLGIILDEINTNNMLIDFMSIDVEGHEFDVLQSNNWEKYRPSIICVEKLNYDLNNVHKSRIYNLLTDKHYKLFAKTVNSWFYRNIEIKFKALDK